MVKLIKVLALATAFSFTTGCGGAIPVISSEQYEKKISVLVITGESLTADKDAALHTSLLNWRNENGMAFEWAQNVNNLKQLFTNEIKSKPYDYVLVYDNQLALQAAGHTGEFHPGRWLLLYDGIAPASVKEAVKTEQVSIRTFTDAAVNEQWNEWVKQQQMSSKVLQWITMKEKPLPEHWVQEGDEPVSWEETGQWLTALQAQISKRKPDYLVIYSPLPKAEDEQQLTELSIPIIHMNQAASKKLDPNRVLHSVLVEMKEQLWQPGLRFYDQADLKSAE